MGFRDVHFSKNQKYYFVACSDSSAVSRLDSYFANFSFPWDKPKEQDNVSLAVGSLECWAKPAEGIDIAYERLWTKSLKSQAICFGFSEVLKLVAVGCDDGSVTILKLSDQAPTKFSDFYISRLHDSRVMKMVFDEKKNCLYSVSEDKFLKILNLSKKEVSYQLAASGLKPTAMEVDLKHRIAYVADCGGNIAVLTLATNPPMYKQCFKAFPLACYIRALYIDFESGCLLASNFNDGMVTEFCILDPSNPETKIEERASVRGTPKSRVIQKCIRTGDIFVGHTDGVVSALNFQQYKQGPIFSAKVHDGNVTQLQLLDNGKKLVTISTDKTIKVK